MYCNLYVLSVNAISRIVGEIGRMSSRPCWADLGEHLSAGIFTVYVCLSLNVDHRRSKEKVFPAVSTWVVTREVVPPSSDLCDWIPPDGSACVCRANQCFGTSLLMGRKPQRGTYNAMMGVREHGLYN